MLSRPEHWLTQEPALFFPGRKGERDPSTLYVIRWRLWSLSWLPLTRGPFISYQTEAGPFTFRNEVSAQHTVTAQVPRYP